MCIYIYIYIYIYIRKVWWKEGDKGQKGNRWREKMETRVKGMIGERKVKEEHREQGREKKKGKRNGRMGRKEGKEGRRMEREGKSKGGEK